MQYLYSFIQLSSDFSQEHADHNHDGLESENNVKYRWEDSLKISDKATFLEERDDVYLLAGETDDGPFSFEIPNMKIEEFTSDEGSTLIAISKSLILNIEKKEESNQIETIFLLTDEDLIINPIPGVYISVADFPEDLK